MVLERCPYRREVNQLYDPEAEPVTMGAEGEVGALEAAKVIQILQSAENIWFGLVTTSVTTL